MDIEDRWTPDKAVESLNCYGTSSLEHPGTLMVATQKGEHYVGGKITGLTLPERVFPCKTPADVRADLPANTDVVAFQCRNPIHRAHYELFTRALEADNVAGTGIVLVHPTCGPTQADDIDGKVRFQTYEVLKEETKNPRVEWAYLPYSMHMAGPREAIQHMMIRKNYGCTHFIIGRDMAGSKSSISGDDFYGAYDAQEMARQHSAELGVQTVESLNLVSTEQGYMTVDAAEAAGLPLNKLSGTEFRKRLRAGEEIPEWFAFKSVVEVLRKSV
jgi:sulfate adenylyltransferase